MLKAGTTLCVKCGNVFSKLYYFNSKDNVWVTLNRTVTGKYYVEQRIDENVQDNSKSLNYTDFKLNTKKSIPNKGIPKELYIDYISNGEQKTDSVFKRICPFCAQKGKINNIVEGLGDVPTYVVAVIGSKAVGKSCWIRSLSCPENQNALADFRYHIDSPELKASMAKPLGSTKLSDKGETVLLTISRNSAKSFSDSTSEEKKKNILTELLVRIKNKKGSQYAPVAKVLMLDFAGELFTKAKREEFLQSHAYSLFAGTDDYSGVDAVILMDEVEDKDSTNEKVDITEVYNCIKDLELLQNKPVAYVINKIDKFFENPPMTTIVGSDKKVPLLTADTFKHYDEDIYAKSKIMSRFCIDKYIVSKYSDVAEKIFINNVHSSGFLIKTLQPYADEYSGKIDDDYTDSINVMDPLIWILNELDIFPIV